MKKRVISWLLCLALCLSMLPMAALAEDVQAPEGPAPSMNEPQPEPRAKENETPAPESGAKIQSELMTAGNLFMPRQRIYRLLSHSLQHKMVISSLMKSPV